MSDDDSTIITPLLGISHVWYTRQTMTLPIVLYVNGWKVETIALVNSGAAGIFIDRNFAEENKLETVSITKMIAVYNVDGTENQDGSIDKKITADLNVKGRKMKTQFLVTALGSQRVILVYPWLVYANSKINWKKQEFSWWDTIPKVNIYELVLKIQDQIEQEVHKTDNNLVIAFLWGINKTEEEIDKWIQECIDPDQTTINAIPAGEQWVKNKMTQSRYLASHEAQQRKKMDVESLVPKEFHHFIPTVFSE